MGSNGLWVKRLQRSTRREEAMVTGRSSGALKWLS